jgi:hypothetical protein
MARNAEKLGAHIVGAANGTEPGGTTAQNCAADRNDSTLLMVEGAIEADIS